MRLCKHGWRDQISNYTALFFVKAKTKGSLRPRHHPSEAGRVWKDSRDTSSGPWKATRIGQQVWKTRKFPESQEISKWNPKPGTDHGKKGLPGSYPKTQNAETVEENAHMMVARQAVQLTEKTVTTVANKDIFSLFAGVNHYQNKTPLDNKNCLDL